MTTVEARTRQALHDVVDRLSVTDVDVARMETELLVALENPRRLDRARVPIPRRRRWVLVALAAAAAVVGGLALSADDRTAQRPAGAPVSDQPLIPSDLVGTWRGVPDSRYVWVFNADGRVSVDPTAGDYLEGDFKDRILTRDGDLYTVHTEDGCDEMVRIRAIRPGFVALSGQRTSCDRRLGPESEKLRLERVSPEPYLEGELSVPVPSEQPGFVEQSSFIDGVWLHVETGTVLALGRPWGGTVMRYVLDDDGDGKSDPDQRGRVTETERRPPVFRPDATAAGTQCVLSLSSLVILRATMTTTSAAGGCLPGPGPHTWVRIS